MSGQTQSQYLIEDDAEIYHILPSESVRTELDRINKDSQSNSFHEYESEMSTNISENQSGKNTYLLRHEATDVHSERLKDINKSLKSEIPGSIINIENASVVCEIYLDNSQTRTMLIRLPKNLFPEDVHYGSPITLAYDEDEYGIRHPSIKLRELKMTKPMKQENEELEALIEKF